MCWVIGPVQTAGFAPLDGTDSAVIGNVSEVPATHATVTEFAPKDSTARVCVPVQPTGPEQRTAPVAQPVGTAMIVSLSVHVIAVALYAVHMVPATMEEVAQEFALVMQASQSAPAVHVIPAH